jgi:hypothetical protein
MFLKWLLKYYSAPSYHPTEAPPLSPLSTKTPEYYNTTYAAPSYYTEAPKYCTTKAPEYFNTTYATPSYYTEAPRYYSAPSYYTPKAPEYYTTTYASPTYYKDAPKY